MHILVLLILIAVAWPITGPIVTFIAILALQFLHIALEVFKAAWWIILPVGFLIALRDKPKTPPKVLSNEKVRHSSDERGY